MENPPIVIAQLETAYRQEGDETVRVEVVPSELTERYPDYNVYVGKIRTTDMQTVVMIDPTRVPASAASELTENPLLVGPGEYGLGGSDGTAVEESGDGGQSPASGEVTALRVTNG